MVIRAFAFPVDLSGVAGALAKIERVMPTALQRRTLALQENIHFNAPPPPTAVRSEVVKALITAMEQGRQVTLQYRSWNDERTERTFEPYGVVFHEGWWYVAGWCHLRQNARTFRLDRIEQVAPAEGAFVRPEAFDALGHVQAALSHPRGIAPVEVLFLTSLDEAKRALPAEFGTLETVAEGVLFRRPAYRLEWVAPMLLSLDFPIRIVQPVELKTLMERLAEKALQMAGAAT